MEHDFTGLLSRQEAALNAAGEALTELKVAGFSLNMGPSTYPAGFQVWGYATTASGDAIWGHGETLAAAAAECIAKIEEARAEGPKLKTAAEAVDAVKALLPEVLNDTAIKLVSEKIDALPVKR